MNIMHLPRLAALLALSASLVAMAQPAPPAPVLTMTADQIRALGVQTDVVKLSSELAVGTQARVVLRPDAQTVVAAPYAGFVPRLFVSFGETVKVGQPLGAFVSAQLTESERALFDARSEARLARQALERDRALLADGIIAASRWEATQARSSQAEATVRAREAERASTGIASPGPGQQAALVAPRAGVVADVQAVLGARVDAGSPLFRIVDPSSLELDMLIGQDAPVPARGDRVLVEHRGASGEVIGTAPTGDGSAAMRVRASLQKPGNLRAGESVQATVEIRGSRQAGGAPLARLPAAALAYVAGRPGVFVAVAQGFVFKNVDVASTNDAIAVVRSPDLVTDSRVAVTGVGALKGLMTGSP